MKVQYTVTVTTDTKAHANQIMEDQIGKGKYLGYDNNGKEFDYVVSWKVNKSDGPMTSPA